jgi:hypothetical protein
VLAGLVALVLVAPASASTANKPYTLTISPPLMEGGQENVTITATFKNQTGPPGGQQLGSANLIWPTSIFANVTASSVSGAGAAATASSGTCTFGTVTGSCIKLRNLSLSPGPTPLTVTMSATTQTCFTTPEPWVVEAKQSNDFSGPPGNDLTLSSAPQSTLDGACKLAWISQPTDSLTNDPISSVPFTPGSPISVKVVDSSGKVLPESPAPTVTLTAPSNPGAVTPAGASEPASGGIASFPNLTINSPGDFYTLTASSGTLSSVPSNAFDVADTYTFAPCSVNASCSTTDSNNKGSGKVMANTTTTSGTLTLSVNSNNGNTLPCSYVSADQNVYGFDGPGSKVGTITITNPNLSSPTLTGTAWQIISAQQICFDGPVDFTTASGTPAPPDPTGSGFVGLLPTCTTDPDSWDDPDGDADDPTGPCHNRQQDHIVRDLSSPLGYDIVLVADIPPEPGDPHMS